MQLRLLTIVCLLALAPVLQSAELGGHLAATLEADNNQGQARDLGADLLIDDWLLGVYLTQRDVTYEERSGNTQVNTQNWGTHLSYQGDVWGSGLAYNRYDDGELVQTREWTAKASWRHGPVKLSANAHQRQHDLSLTISEPELRDAFDSTGLGLGLRWEFENTASLYGNYIHYDYSKDQLLEETLRQLRLLYLFRPDDRRRLLSALFSVRGANAQVRGNLIANGYSVGVDYPIGEHWLSLNYTLNEAEVDGSQSDSASVYWSHNLSPAFGLDIYAGLARGDQLADSSFAGLTLHWFIEP